MKLLNVIDDKEIFELVPIEERKYIAEHCTSKIAGINLVDIDAATDYMMKRRKEYNMSTIIQIMPIFPNKVKDTNLVFTIVKDNKFNVHYGIMTELDQNKNPKFRRIRFENGITLNLEDPENAKMWTVIRMHAKVAGSPNAVFDPIFYVEDPSIQARKNISKATQMSRAFGIIDSLDGKELVSLGRYMGIELINSFGFETITGTLKEKAMSNPEDFLRKFDNSNRQYEELFVTAIELGVVREEVGKGYFYESILMGMTREEGIEKLRTDAGIRQSVISETRHKDETVKRIVSEYDILKKKKASVVDNTEDNKKEF
jgi:hypothetical protein